MENQQNVLETLEQDTRKRVILMGQTGAGKSTFISNIIGRDIGVGHALESRTRNIDDFETKFGSETVFLVDMPGFDDSDVPDIVLLKKLSDWLKKRAIRESAIVGVVYLHMINAPRMPRSAKQNLHTFQALCGEEYSPKIVIVTTHWVEDINSRLYGDQCTREAECMQSSWKMLLQNGARVERLGSISGDFPFARNTIDRGQAQSILHTVLGIETEGKNDLLFRDEVVKQKKKVNKTTAANVVEDSITERLKELKGEKQKLEEMGDTVEELQRIKDEVRSLKFHRAKLRGSILGQLRYGL